jgi:hypothetical protein
MRIFDFDPREHRDQYAQQGWVHVRGGISPDFLAALSQYVDDSFGSHRVEGTAIGGRKSQALYEFPPDVDFPGELFDVIAAVADLNRPTMTLSERHIKAYDDDAPADPIPHKDRYASQVSVGLSIDIPENSRLVLYPKDHTEVNPFNVSAAYLESLGADERPEIALRDANEVVIDDQPGDVMMFRGNAIWHMRRNAANATNLYLKLNDFNCDPLGEDPSTPERREQTLAAVSNGGNLGDLVATLSRRLDWVSQQYTREWHEVAQARVWEQPITTLSDVEFQILKAVDGGRRVTELASELESRGLDRGSVEAHVGAMAERELLDLVS